MEFPLPKAYSMLRRIHRSGVARRPRVAISAVGTDQCALSVFDQGRCPRFARTRAHQAFAVRFAPLQRAFARVLRSVFGIHDIVRKRHLVILATPHGIPP
jgi:hypothetical protein